jgi:hypothetical protein
VSDHALEDAVKRRLRLEFADAVKSGELDFSELVENTGPAGTRTRDLRPPPRGDE